MLSVLLLVLRCYVRRSQFRLFYETYLGNGWPDEMSNTGWSPFRPRIDRPAEKGAGNLSWKRRRSHFTATHLVPKREIKGCQRCGVAECVKKVLFKASFFTAVVIPTGTWYSLAFVCLITTRRVPPFLSLSLTHAPFSLQQLVQSCTRSVFCPLEVPWVFMGSHG